VVCLIHDAHVEVLRRQLVEEVGGGEDGRDDDLSGGVVAIEGGLGSAQHFTPDAAAAAAARYHTLPFALTSPTPTTTHAPPLPPNNPPAQTGPSAPATKR